MSKSQKLVNNFGMKKFVIMCVLAFCLCTMGLFGISLLSSQKAVYTGVFDYYLLGSMTVL